MYAPLPYRLATVICSQDEQLHLAIARRVRVLQRAAGESDVVLEVLRAGLAVGRVDDGVFDRGAFGGRVGYGRG